MLIEISLETIVNSISIIIGIFLGLHFLFLYKGNRRANIFLALYLVLTSVSVLGSEIEEHLVLPSYLPMLLMLLSSPFIISAILFYYSLALTGTYKTRAKKYRWLLIPALIEIAVTVPFIEYNAVNFNEITFFSIEIVLAITSLLFSIYVLTLVLLQLKKHNKNIFRIFSSVENKQLNWLRFLIIINIAFALIWLIDDCLAFAIGDNVISESIAVMSLFATCFTIVWIGFAGLRQVAIFDTKEMELKAVHFPNLNSKELYSDTVYEDIKKRIEAEKMYLDPELSLFSLAKKLDMKTKELSSIINKEFENNFYHFINYFRVNHFKNLLKSPSSRQMSIEGLSIESGFNSKSTFYTAFKKLEGITPKQYELRLKSLSKANRTL